MITPESRLIRFCKNFQEIENYQEAVNSPERYHLHHRKEIETLEDGTVVLRSKKELKELNLYYNRPAGELIFLKPSEHSSIHNRSENIRAESRLKMSAAHKGKMVGEKNPMYGKKPSAETRAKISAANIGEKNGMYGKKRSGCKNPNWKGGISLDHNQYMRIRKEKKRAATSSLSTS